MTLLTPTAHHGTVVWLGLVRDRAATLRAEPVEAVELGFEGPLGDSHAGLTRPACTRVRAQHPKGAEIRNTRQISLLSAEDLAAIAATLGLPELDPALIGASLVVEGIPDLTRLPPPPA